MEWTRTLRVARSRWSMDISCITFIACCHRMHHFHCPLSVCVCVMRALELFASTTLSLSPLSLSLCPPPTHTHPPSLFIHLSLSPPSCLCLIRVCARGLRCMHDVTTREGQRALPTGHACEHALQIHRNVSFRDLADLLAEADTHSNTQPVLPDL